MRHDMTVGELIDELSRYLQRENTTMNDPVRIGIPTGHPLDGSQEYMGAGIEYTGYGIKDATGTHPSMILYADDFPVPIGELASNIAKEIKKLVEETPEPPKEPEKPKVVSGPIVPPPPPEEKKTQKKSKDPNFNKSGKAIRKMRDQMHLSREAFAKKVGIDKGVLSDYERGITEVPLEDILRIADRCKVNSESIIDGTVFDDKTIYDNRFDKRKKR